MADDGDWDGGSPWLFFLGLIIFLGSGLLFLADLLRGIDVLRSIAANAVGVALLITWAAHDTLNNPDSEVASTSGAAGTALLLYGLYLLASGAVIALTGLFHDRLQLGFIYVGLAIVTILIGLKIFPTGALTDDEQDESAVDDQTDDPASEGEPSESVDGNGTDDPADEDETNLTADSESSLPDKPTE